MHQESELPMRNLYEVPIGDATFELFCGGNLSGEHEACADVAAIPGVADGFVIRDSKPEGVGRELRFTGAELDKLAIGWAKKRGLPLAS
ncbi:DUF397 domain-containing protein [Streptomyces tsukubensis]|uniref:DUF397 domain-containing protein n=1 Tax=Streptomyces tsukubensis TaxID=83656 RepID=UPI0036BEA636